MKKSNLETIKEYVENMRRDGDSNLVNILNQIYKAIEIEKLRNKDGGQVERVVRLQKAKNDSGDEVDDIWAAEYLDKDKPITEYIGAVVIDEDGNFASVEYVGGLTPWDEGTPWRKAKFNRDDKLMIIGHRV